VGSQTPERHQTQALYDLQSMDARALLLTDVVDSTRLVEQLGDERAAEIWAAHDRVARDLLAPHGGLEIDKTDGFLLLFESASAAAAYALAYHAGLATLSTKLGVPLAARAGLHYATVVLRENTPEDIARGAKPLEVEGIAKPTAARVMSVAGAGQTLMTAEARQRLDEGEIRSHGWWRMKGVQEPVELFEIGTEESAFLSPRDGGKVYRVVRQDDGWRPAREIPNNLPSNTDTFFGRRSELRELGGRLADTGGVITLLGPGGTGKTRLSLEFGHSHLGDYPGGAWFVQLEDVRAADPLLAALANAAGVKLMGADPTAFLAAVLQERGPTLFVLDNFEQLVEAGAPVLEALAAAAPSVAWLVSSREVLRIRGEQVLRLDALSTPPVGADFTQIQGSDAVALFECRAANLGRFALTEQNAPHVAELVRLLDGMPLAIELAAARARVMKPAKLVARMSRRFDLLAAGRRGARPRQATLRGAIDWSWELLSGPERLALAQCSVFRGGFTLEAAEEVLDLSAFPDAPWPMDVVQALMDKSLLRSWIPDGGIGEERVELSDPVFGMYVSIHEYASEKLRSPDAVPGPDGPTTGPEHVRALLVRHAEYYAEAEAAAGEEGWTPGPEDIARLALDRDNLALAFETALEVQDADLASSCWLALAALTLKRGPASAAADRFVRLDVDAVSDPARRDQLLKAALLPMRQLGRIDEERRAAEALAALRSARGDRVGALEARAAATRAGMWTDPSAGNARLRALREEAEGVASPALLMQLEHDIALTAPSLEETRATLTRLAARDDSELATTAAYNLSCVLLGLGELDEARATAERVLQWAEERGERRFEMLGVNNIGQAWAAGEEWERAEPLLREALRLATALEDRRFQYGGPTVVLAVAEVEAGDPLGARRRVEHSLPLQRALGDPTELAWTLSALAETWIATGDLAQARRLLEEADAASPGLKDKGWHTSHWVLRAWRRLEEREASVD